MDIGKTEQCLRLKIYPCDDGNEARSRERRCFELWKEKWEIHLLLWFSYKAGCIIWRHWGIETIAILPFLMYRDQSTTLCFHVNFRGLFACYEGCVQGWDRLSWVGDCKRIRSLRTQAILTKSMEPERGSKVWNECPLCWQEQAMHWWGTEWRLHVDWVMKT